MNTFSTGEQLILDGLRARGFCVVIWTPGEIPPGAEIDDLQDAAINAGSNYLEGFPVVTSEEWTGSTAFKALSEAASELYKEYELERVILDSMAYVHEPDYFGSLLKEIADAIGLVVKQEGEQWVARLEK